MQEKQSRRRRLIGLACCWTTTLMLTSTPAPAAATDADDAGHKPRLAVQTGHGDQVTSLAFSPDGALLLSGSDDKTARVWDLATGREIRTFGGHADQVLSVAFAPDGRTIATGSWDKKLILRDVRTGKTLHVLQDNGWVLTARFSPDGRLLASGTRGNRATVWDVATGRPLHHFAGHQSNVTGVAFSPDGKALASVSLDGTLGLMDVESGRVLARQAISDTALTAVVFLPDNKTLAIASLDRDIHLWNIQTGKQTRLLRGHNGGVHALALSRDGRALFSIGADKTIRRWDTTSGALLASTPVPDYAVSDFSLKELAAAPGALAVSPDGSSLAWPEGEKIQMTTPAGARTLEGAADEIRLVQAFDNRLEAHTAERQLAMWQLDAGNVVGRLEADGIPQQESDELFASTQNDRFGMSWGFRSEQVRLWNNDSGANLAPLPVRCADAVAVAPDGAVAATVGGCPKRFSVNEGKLVERTEVVDTMQKNDVWLWNTATGRALGALSGHGMAVQSLAFSPDGALLASGGADQTIRLWNPATRQPLRVLRAQTAGQNRWIDALAFSPDGRMLAAGARDSVIELWDVAAGTLRMTLSGHLSGIRSVAFSADGRFVISASEDKTVRYWRVADGAWLATLYSFVDGGWAVTAPDGRFDAADLEDIKGLHWVMPDDPLTPLPLEAFMREYYEPRLLSRILNGEVFKPVRPVSELNRIQPTVRILRMVAVAGVTGMADVSVEATGARRDARATAVHDLRLFRNGQLVGYRDGKLADAGQTPYRETFRVRLSAGDKMHFSAYAFNDDGIKSPTAQQDFSVPAPAPVTVVVAAAPRAWIVTIGVNRHEQAAWNLEYAANDANRIRESLVTRLRQQQRYKEIIAVSLVSDVATAGLASKRNLKAVFDRLAGKPADVSAIPGGDKLDRALPDDLVIISFSGHGVSQDGRFYLIPADTGTGSEQRRSVTPELLAHAISSEELSNWLRDVDGGDIAMIIDACQSAASVGVGFKPGPMGARGLGQLAYEKGMRLLVASQAEEFAQESSITQQGLLSYALVNDGLEQGRADYRPADGKITLAEWLNFGLQRVPSLVSEVARGRLDERGAKVAGAPRDADAQRSRSLQQPALFDFTKNRRDAVLTSAPSRP
jgi:WD40 repeat protein/uncharacterized caspase-like protein